MSFLMLCGVDLREKRQLRIGCAVVDRRVVIFLLAEKGSTLRGAEHLCHIDILRPATGTALIENDVVRDAQRLSRPWILSPQKAQKAQKDLRIHQIHFVIFVPLWLKRELSPELNISRVIPLRRHETKSGVWRCSRTRIQTHSRSKVWMIERIQSLGTKLKFPRFAHLEILRNG